MYYTMGREVGDLWKLPKGFVALAVYGCMAACGLIALPSLGRSRIAANQASAVGSLRTLHTALTTYAGQAPVRGYPKSLNDLGRLGLIDEQLPSGTREDRPATIQDMPLY